MTICNPAKCKRLSKPQADKCYLGYTEPMCWRGWLDFSLVWLKLAKVKLIKVLLIIGIIALGIGCAVLDSVKANAASSLRPFDGYREFAEWVSSYQPIESEHCLYPAQDMMENGIAKHYLVHMEIVPFMINGKVAEGEAHEYVVAYVRMGDGALHVYMVEPATRQISNELFGIKWIIAE